MENEKSTRPGSGAIEGLDETIRKIYEEVQARLEAAAPDTCIELHGSQFCREPSDAERLIELCEINGYKARAEVADGRIIRMTVSQ